MAQSPGQRLVLFSGPNGAVLGNTFEWDGQAWEGRGQLPGPSNRDGVCMAYDSLRGRTLLYGGLAYGAAGVGLDEVWAYVQPLPPSITLQPGDATACVGQQVTFTVDGTSLDPIGFQWRHEGIPIPGAASATFSLSADPASSGEYDCLLTNPCGSAPSRAALLRVNSADFNNDGDSGTDADIEAFFACIAGHCCPTCGSPDFNNDGDTATDADIESFFRVLGGGPC